METWREDALPGHTHDPNEVTVQIDGLGRQLADLSAAPGQQGPADGPVFVDETGRRGRMYRRVGALVGIACAVYAMVIVGTLFSGNSSAPWLPMPGPKDDRPASKVDTPNRPAAPTDPSVTTDASASPDATDDAGATPGAGGDAPDPSRGAVDDDREDTAPDTDTDTGSAGGGKSKPRPDPADDDAGPRPDPAGGTAGPGAEPTTPTDPPADPSSNPPDPATDGGTGAGAGGAEVPVGYTPSAERPSSDTVRSSGAKRSFSGTTASFPGTKTSSEDAQR
ncbi:hypothetical protein [Streptomyces sp. NPDC002564]|uniref:hypothetical protein n=1 Tax=Streptomyces sp. NPDC002564 TaxID=3364649 RepID=UPI0036AAD088